MKNEYYYLVKNAQMGDEVSMYKLIRTIEPLINKYSRKNNIIDEDSRSYLIEQCIINIKKWMQKKFY